MSLIIPKLILPNRQKPYLHLWKREVIWAWYKFLCHIQHQQVLETTYEIDLIKPNGKISDRIKGRNESFVRNFYNFLAQNLLGIQPSTYSMGAYGEGSLTVRDTGGTDRTMQLEWMRSGAPLSMEVLNTSVGYGGIRAGATFISEGIVFDQSDTAYTFEQTVGVTPVANGTGANQLVYGDTWLPYMTYDASGDKWTCIWERMALNNTAGQTSVDVKSICLYGGLVGTGNAMIVMLARDVLVSTITVPYGSQIKGRWTLTHDR